MAASEKKIHVVYENTVVRNWIETRRDMVLLTHERHTRQVMLLGIGKIDSSVGNNRNNKKQSTKNE